MNSHRSPRPEILRKLAVMKRTIENLETFVNTVPAPAFIPCLSEELEKTLDETQPELTEWVRTLREESTL